MIETWIANHLRETFQIILVLIALLFWAVWKIWSLEKEAILNAARLKWYDFFEKHFFSKKPEDLK